jgi:HK97 family phage portal protein
MGRLSEAFSAAKRAFLRPENAAETTGWIPDWMLGSASASGVRVTPITAMGVPTVIACVNARSRPLASMPLNLHRRLPNGGSEIAYDHYLHYLMNVAPNDEMVAADFRRAVFANSSLRNQAFSIISRDGMERIREIYPVPNYEMQVDRDPTTKKLTYRVNGQVVPSRMVMHVKGLTFEGVVGADAVSLARDSIGLAIALQDHAARYFPNSISPSAMFSMDGFLKPDQLPMIKAEIMKRIGLNGAHEPMILQGGAKPIDFNKGDNQKGQFVEARKAQDKAICQIFGVPQSKAGIMDDAHYATAEEASRSFVTDTLIPDAVQFEQLCNVKLLGPIEQSKYFFRFDFDELLRGKALERAQAQKVYLEAGVKNRNEVRVQENHNPVPGGEKFFISQNVQLLDKEGNPVPKPVPISTESQSQTT